MTIDVFDLPVSPLGEQNFDDLRASGAIYVDKTEHLYRMMRDQKNIFFARPRRFGKSLMLSTLREIYRGNKDLFAGTWIYDRYDFKPYHVLYVNFSEVTTQDGKFYNSFVSMMREIAHRHNVNADQVHDPADILRLLLQSLSKKSPVVVLIDEYDRPLHSHIGQPEVFARHHEIMQSFYAQLKTSSVRIHKAVLTGVSQFARLSLFSGANQFSDVSLDPWYATLCGYTRSEIATNFGEHIAYALQETGMDEQQWWHKLETMYNGYSWDTTNIGDVETRVFCPFTVLSYFRAPHRFGDYWFQTGMPTMLYKLMKSGQINPFDLDESSATGPRLSTADIERKDLTSTMFQTGYLTLKERLPGNNNAYKLGYPNEEVERAFTKGIWTEFLGTQFDSSTISLDRAAMNEEWDEFFYLINSSLTRVQYPLFDGPNKEKSAHMALHCFLIPTSLNPVSEYNTSRGRSDIVLNFTFKSVAHTIIIELKASQARPDDQPVPTPGDDLYISLPAHTQDNAPKPDQQLALEALQQTIDKGYAEKAALIQPGLAYESLDGSRAESAAVTLIGATVNIGLKSVTAWQVRKVRTG